MQVDRREVLAGVAASGLAALPWPGTAKQIDAMPWARTWHAALETLDANVGIAPGLDSPVLFEGPIFQGIWLECGPHESLAHAELSDSVRSGAAGISPLDVARNSHRIFFANQRPDGQLPAYLNKRSGINFGQVQMVVPIAATAWETARRLKDNAFLLEAYHACSRWDEWLRVNRNTRGTGLIEAFCAFDTGQDNSPRWAGVSDECPGRDAKRFTSGQSVPRLCPDLSATVFGARTALSRMALALGKKDEAKKWKVSAEQMRAAIVDRLWCPEDASFYDVAPDGNFVRVRSVANLRVLGEHVLRLDVPKERRIFDALWERQLHNPGAYWARFPFPSIALNDPKFVRPIPFNSWGGASQALTALRALRWMDYYGKSRELEYLLAQWCIAIFRAGFCQQLDPNTGEATKSPIDRYSPTALLFLHAAQRLGNVPKA